MIWKRGENVVLLRTLIVYALLLLAMRLLGKRQLGELELSELVVTVLVADIAVRPILEPEAPLIGSLAPLAVLFGCDYLISVLSLKSVRLRTILFGTPSMLIRHGKVDQRELRRNRFTLDELMQELRKQGVQDLTSVESAVLETSGALNLLLRAEEQPLTPKQLGLEVAEPGYYTILVNDGRTLSENLRRMGRDERWLDRELRARGAKSAREVYLFLLNDAGEICFEMKED